MARSKSRAKAKQAAKPAKRAKARGAATSAVDAQVEERWREYWSRRTALEDAVSQVREAREALNLAIERESACRAEFDEIKRGLTELLDVEPAGPPRPVAVTDLRGPSAKTGG